MCAKLSGACRPGTANEGVLESKRLLTVVEIGELVADTKLPPVSGEVETEIYFVGLEVNGLRQSGAARISASGCEGGIEKVDTLLLLMLVVKIEIPLLVEYLVEARPDSPPFGLDVEGGEIRQQRGHPASGVGGHPASGQGKVAGADTLIGGRSVVE